MNKLTPKNLQLNNWDKTTLPATVRTKGGVVFDPRPDVWDYRDGLTRVQLDFTDLPVSDELLNSFKATLAWYAQNRAPAYLISVFNKFYSFIESVYELCDQSLEILTGTDIVNQRVSLGYHMKHIASVLRKWASLGYPGLGPDVIQVLDKIVTKSPETGVAVKTLDPKLGPFSPIEQVGIQDALNEAYGSRAISEEGYLLAWLFIALGARPVQIASMKVCDLSQTVAPDGSEMYIIKVPRAKQRNASIRDALKPRPLVRQIGSPLYAYAQKVKARFEGRLSDAGQAPLFPVEPQYEEFADYPGWARFHRKAVSLRATLKVCLDKLNVFSERTGERLNIAPIRFRRTFGTNAAQEGHGLLVIAELLDHSGTESAEVYVAATPELAGRIEKALALHMAPLAQAFKGRVIQGESEATRGADPSSRIVDLRIDQSAKTMGSCGQFSFCGFAAPIACYTCKSFEPWLDGPHEAVLDHLLAERERFIDSRIAAVNDRTIIAVAQVVQMCRQIKEQSNG